MKEEGVSRAGSDRTTAKETGTSTGSEVTLLLVVGNGHLSTHVLEPDRALVLGRDAACDIALDHPAVSRRHAIVRGGSPVTVQDAGSTNGILVGARRLGHGECGELAAGDTFRIGPFRAVIV